MSKKEIISTWFYEYSDDIYQFLYYRLSSKHYDVEDLVQEVFIKALRSIEDFQGKSSPKTWLYSIAKNVATDAIRKKKRDKWKWFLSFDSGQETPRDNSESPESIFLSSEGQFELLQAIRSLKESYQDVLIMRSIKELTVSDTAEILGWSENKVRSTLHRAKLALQAKLGGESFEK